MLPSMLHEAPPKKEAMHYNPSGLLTQDEEESSSDDADAEHFLKDLENYATDMEDTMQHMAVGLLRK